MLRPKITIDQLRKNLVRVDIDPEYIEQLVRILDMDTCPATFIEQLILAYIQEHLHLKVKNTCHKADLHKAMKMLEGLRE